MTAIPLTIATLFVMAILATIVAFEDSEVLFQLEDPKSP
jgi:hypothetical protein